MDTDKDLVELRAAIARLEGDPFFVASILANYRAEFHLSDQQIAKALNCSSQALTNLALCRTPRSGDEGLFLSDIQTIAKYVGCDWKELAKIVRTVQSLATLKRLSEAAEHQLLKAARDKRRDKNDPDKPKSRKR